MLVIRMQRTGRKGHAMFRVVVQDSRRTPTSGKIVAQLGSYDPHSKAVSINKEKAQFYLDHGAQPSERVAALLKTEGVKLPAWVSSSDAKTRTTRNPDKRRSTRPPEAEPVEAAAEAEPVETPVEPAEETPVEESIPAEPETTAPETAPEEAPEALEPVEEAPAEETTPAPETTESATSEAAESEESPKE